MNIFITWYNIYLKSWKPLITTSLLQACIKVMWCQGVLRLASIAAKGVLMNHVGSKLFIQRINDLGAELCIARLIT